MILNCLSVCINKLRGVNVIGVKIIIIIIIIIIILLLNFQHYASLLHGLCGQNVHSSLNKKKYNIGLYPLHLKTNNLRNVKTKTQISSAELHS